MTAVHRGIVAKIAAGTALLAMAGGAPSGDEAGALGLCSRIDSYYREYRGSAS